MKKFLLKFIVAASISFVICLCVVCVSQVILRQASYKIPEEKHIVILGDSHTECAIDDQILTSAINLSKSGTGYLYSYVFLNKLIESNNHIDTVVLSFFDISLSKSYDEVLYSQQRTSFTLPLFISMMSTEDISALDLSITSVATAYLDAVKYIPSIVFGRGDFQQGGYLKLNRNKLHRDINENYGTNYHLPAKYIDFNTIQSEFLHKIKNLCDKNGIALILMNTPTYMVERFTNSNLFDNECNSLLKGYQYVDYSKFKLPEDCYGDVTHLNYKGAQLFSRYLKEKGFFPSI